MSYSVPSVASFARARTSSEDALSSIRDAARVWLTEEIVRQAKVKFSLGDGEQAGDFIKLRLEILSQYNSPTKFTPAALLTDEGIQAAMNYAASNLADSIVGCTGCKVNREVPGLGRNFENKLVFVVSVDTRPF